MPIARAYDPQIVLVSAGFDAADGHAPPLGGYKVSPKCKHVEYQGRRPVKTPGASTPIVSPTTTQSDKYFEQNLA